MNKTDLVNLIAEKENITKVSAHSIVDTVCDLIRDALCDGDEVVIPGIGKIKPKTRAARTGRNPQTGDPLQIPAKKTVSFSVSKTLADTLNK